MSDGNLKDVPVLWEPSVIDTSVAGTRTVVGTVEGYNGSVSLTVIVNDVVVGSSQISLFKDSTSSGNKVNFSNITGFYLKSKETGKTYSEGKVPSQSSRKNQIEMKDLPKGEYTIHAKLPEGMVFKEIQLGEAYKETIYNAESNPVIIDGDKTTYVKIVISTENTLKEIKPLEALTVPTSITLDQFKEALPKKTTIVDSSGKEHQVDLKWDIRPANFENYKKNGKTTLWSEFFTLPINVSNTDPATRLEVILNVVFEEPINLELEAAIATADEGVNGLSEAVAKAKNISQAQEEINKAQEKVNKVIEIDNE